MTRSIAVLPGLVLLAVSLDCIGSGLARAGDVIRGERFLEDANPIVLLMAAVAVDALGLVLWRSGWLKPAATSLYVAGAVSAGLTFWTGLRAAATVYLPGMAPPLIAEHQAWALATTVAATVVGLLRLGVQLRGRPGRRTAHIPLMAVGLVLLVLVQQTAERGARLVYEQGVGVIAAPGAQ
jgi:uncharacterized membrane protein